MAAGGYTLTFSHTHFGFWYSLTFRNTTSLGWRRFIRKGKNCYKNSLWVVNKISKSPIAEVVDVC
jgi:hypothetical protein